MTALILENVAVRIDGRRLFEPVSTRIEPGTITCMTGPSGAGKSSLLAHLCGTLDPAFISEGRVLLDREDLGGKPPERRGIGILFQDPLLFPHLSVRGNLLFGMASGEGRKRRRQRVESELASVGLDGFGDRDPATLSGGQKARIALLRVLLAEPHALLLDEPFGALDDANRVRIRELVFSEVRRRRLPALLVTHDASDAAAAGGPVTELVCHGRGIKAPPDAQHATEVS